jgi:hypothetical protein
MDLVRRWLRNRESAAAYDDDAWVAPEAEPGVEVQPEPVQAAEVQPAIDQRAANQQATIQPKSQSLKKPAQSKQRKKAA